MTAVPVRGQTIDSWDFSGLSPKTGLTADCPKRLKKLTNFSRNTKQCFATFFRDVPRFLGLTGRRVSKSVFDLLSVCSCSSGEPPKMDVMCRLYLRTRRCNQGLPLWAQNFLVDGEELYTQYLRAQCAFFNSSFVHQIYSEPA